LLNRWHYSFYVYLNKEKGWLIAMGKKDTELQDAFEFVKKNFFQAVIKTV
jgi:hypothetical protein